MRSAEWSFTVGNSSALLLGPNPKRRSLTFSADGSHSVSVTTLGTAAIGTGITLTSQNATQTISIDDIGSRIQQPWYAIASAAGVQLGVFEEFD